uniref:BRCT domain-containing protein n=1 Tax=Steinernema glaseri TaxID=37863 RepID=A0A1I8A130_9BILA
MVIHLVRTSHKKERQRNGKEKMSVVPKGSSRNKEILNTLFKVGVLKRGVEGGTEQVKQVIFSEKQKKPTPTHDGTLLLFVCGSKTCSVPKIPQRARERPLDRVSFRNTLTRNWMISGGKEEKDVPLSELTSEWALDTECRRGYQPFVDYFEIALHVEESRSTPHDTCVRASFGRVAP